MPECQTSERDVIPSAESQVVRGQALRWSESPATVSLKCFCVV